MSLVVLLILAVVWALFLVPQVVRARAEKTPADSIGAFRNQLSVLERTSPSIMVRPSSSLHRPVGTAMATRSQARKRRRDIACALLVAMAGTLLLGLLPPLRFLLVLHVVADLLFAGYLLLLVRARSLAVERDQKVRYLPGPMLAPEPAFLLRRSGS